MPGLTGRRSKPSCRRCASRSAFSTRRSPGPDRSTLLRPYLDAYSAPRAADAGPDREAIEAVMPAVREQIGVLDKAVAGTGYLVGDEFTFADINLLPVLS